MTSVAPGVGLLVNMAPPELLNLAEEALKDRVVGDWDIYSLGTIEEDFEQPLLGHAVVKGKTNGTIFLNEPMHCTLAFHHCEDPSTADIYQSIVCIQWGEGGNYATLEQACADELHWQLPDTEATPGEVIPGEVVVWRRRVEEVEPERPAKRSARGKQSQDRSSDVTGSIGRIAGIGGTSSKEVEKIRELQRKLKDQQAQSDAVLKAALRERDEARAELEKVTLEAGEKRTTMARSLHKIAEENKVLQDQLKDEREQHQECQRKVSTMKELLGNVVADSPRRAEAHKLQQMAEDQASGITPEKELPPEKKRRKLESHENTAACTA